MESTQPKLHKLDIAGDIRRYIQRMFLAAVRDTLELDRDMVGYVIVCWDRKGTCTTTIESRYSPIPAKFAPIIVKDALDRRISVDDAVCTIVGPPSDESA